MVQHLEKEKEKPEDMDTAPQPRESDPKQAKHGVVTDDEAYFNASLNYEIRLTANYCEMTLGHNSCEGSFVILV